MRARKPKPDTMATWTPSFVLIEALTPKAHEWMTDNCPDAGWIGEQMAVEHRYLGDLVHAMRAAGLVCHGNCAKVSP